MQQAFSTKKMATVSYAGREYKIMIIMKDNPSLKAISVIQFSSNTAKFAY